MLIEKQMMQKECMYKAIVVTIAMSAAHMMVDDTSVFEGDSDCSGSQCAHWVWENDYCTTPSDKGYCGLTNRGGK